MTKLRWGIIATGFIAGRFAEGLATSHTGELVAVSSRDLESAKKFANKFGVASAYGSHDELISDPDIDAVYIATPHPFHLGPAIAAAKAGKHILCEKPLAMDLADTEAIIEATQDAGVTLMEAYMYRCHPLAAKVVELIQAGEIGEVALVQATFGYHAPFDPNGRHFAKKLGGGGILDVGGYPASFACMVANAMPGASDPSVKTSGCIGKIDPRCETDTFAIANLEFENGLAAQISCSTQLNQKNAARVHGSKGWIEIEQPWIVNPEGGEWSISLKRNNEDESQVISGVEPRGLYGIEADCFYQLVQGQKPAAPCMTISDTRRVNAILEDWLKQIS